MDKKPEILRIRCSRGTLIRFKRYAAAFTFYEDALNKMLERAGEPSPMKPRFIKYPRKAEKKG